MIGFWEWLTMHNNWVPGTALYIMMFVWSVVVSYRESWKYKLTCFLWLFVVIGTIFNGLSTYGDGYRMYKNHWTTCAKPEAASSFYVFDAQKERCLKPVVGFAPVDDKQVKTLTPKQMETGEWL
uniref:Uncharacterized protein n=1 Tax=Salmonella phage vB_SEnST11_KE22 TaxID=3161173 RepID=A0AAU8GEC3_9CAUD